MGTNLWREDCELVHHRECGRVMAFFLKKKERLHVMEQQQGLTRYTARWVRTPSRRTSTTTRFAVVELLLNTSSHPPFYRLSGFLLLNKKRMSRGSGGCGASSLRAQSTLFHPELCFLHFNIEFWLEKGTESKSHSRPRTIFSFDRHIFS